MAEADPRPVTALATLQFSWGGLLDAEPADGYRVHLVRSTDRGTPGPSLCGIDRFGKDAPGWSVRGGLTGPGVRHTPCAGCAAVAREQFPGLPVDGIGRHEMAAALAGSADTREDPT